jgi:CubicO group peptidase (beta-lactamase class C family)
LPSAKSDLSKKRKMRTDDILRIASLSKPVTAVGVAILAGESKPKGLGQ